jgi:hypothetical protein
MHRFTMVVQGTVSHQVRVQHTLRQHICGGVQYSQRCRLPLQQ